MCGEKWQGSGTADNVAGSPPHVRGKVVECVVFRGYARITPACAGKSEMNATVKKQLQDHPRMCGEKLTLPKNQNEF